MYEAYRVSLYSMKEVFSSLRDDGEMEGTKMIPLKVVDMSQSIRVYPNLLQSQISLKMYKIMFFYTSSLGSPSSSDYPTTVSIPALTCMCCLPRSICVFLKCANEYVRES